MSNTEKLISGVALLVLVLSLVLGGKGYEAAKQEYEQCVAEYIDDDTPAFARMAIEDECEDRAFGDD